MRFYPALLTRGTKLRSLLTSIPPAQQEEIQARIIFEIQVAFVVECKDVLITELLHRKGRDQQSMDDSRQRLQNSIRKREIDSIQSDIGDMVTLSGPDMERLKEIAYPSIGEEELSKMELLRGKKKNYELILDVLNRLTDLRYFIQRYISEATLMPKMRFIHRCFRTITGNEVEAVVIDTMGLDNRKKSILATYHGRYHKIGIADLRAVSTDMKPTAKHF